MPTSLGISVGASGVGSALIVDTPVGRNTEYRRLALEPDQHRDLGDLVFDAVSLLTARIAEHPKPAVTVAYRTDGQAESVRAAAVREGRLVRVVPETTAILALLHTLGVPATAGTVAVADIGASGMTVTVLDRRSGAVMRSVRTGDISGEALNTRIYEHVRRTTDRMRTRMQIDPVLLAARCQGAQEVLKNADVARIDIGEAGPDASVTLTRAELDTLTADLSAAAVDFMRQVCLGALPRPRSLALVGGASGVPSLATALGDAFDGPVVTVPEPASAAAQGAALLGDSPDLGGFRLVGASETLSGSRMPGAIAAAVAVTAIVAGFAVEQFTPPATTDAPVSPAGTSGAVHTEPHPLPAPTETRIPSYDPDSASIDTRVPDDDTYTSPSPVFAPPPTRDLETQTSEFPRTTVTPTPIDQVPTPNSSTPTETTETPDSIDLAPPVTTRPEPVPTEPSEPTETTTPSEPTTPTQPTETTTPEPTTEPPPAVSPTASSVPATPLSPTTTGNITVTSASADGTF